MPRDQIMNRPLLSHAGRHLLNRRDFLRWGGTGLGGIALASLLALAWSFAVDVAWLWRHRHRHAIVDLT